MTKKLSRLQLEQTVSSLLKDLAPYLQSEMPKGYGFALFMFDYGNGGSIAYASSANRQDMIRAIREWLAHVED